MNRSDGRGGLDTILAGARRCSVGAGWLAILAAALCVSCAGTTGPAGSAAGPPSVAVWDLEDYSPASGARPELAGILTGEVMRVFQSSPSFRLVERERLLLALEELRLGSGQLADESTRLRLGKMVGAAAMVFGGWLEAGGTGRLDLRLVDVETGRVLRSTERVFPSTELGRWIESARTAAEDLAGP